MQKFVDCRTKDVARRELYIVEGDSALGSVKHLARQRSFRRIMPVRGKILNCLKADYDKHLQERHHHRPHQAYSAAASRCSGKAGQGPVARSTSTACAGTRVIICTDADVDGFQIRTLILTMIYRLVPTLIEQGYVYIAESPLYEITCKDKTLFCLYDESEKAAILKKLEGKKVLIQRSKGLGENEADMMWDDHHESRNAPPHPASRRMKPPQRSEMFDLLLGDNLSGRKEYIAEHGADYLELADIS